MLHAVRTRFPLENDVDEIAWWRSRSAATFEPKDGFTQKPSPTVGLQSHDVWVERTDAPPRPSSTTATDHSDGVSEGIARGGMGDHDELLPFLGLLSDPVEDDTPAILIDPLLAPRGSPLAEGEDWAPTDNL